jgi:aryl-alcohol dehydrogenase-like predicted oxidoreductase
MEQIDASPSRLDTDSVDLYQIHRFDSNTPVEETMEALHDVVKGRQSMSEQRRSGRQERAACAHRGALRPVAHPEPDLPENKACPCADPTPWLAPDQAV